VSEIATGAVASALSVATLSGKTTFAVSSKFSELLSADVSIFSGPFVLTSIGFVFATSTSLDDCFKFV